jgi:DNA-binding GntR family transcriptional regulator
VRRAPYDDRNKADFNEITQNIKAALKVLERDPGIPVTEASLAELAKCSRGTLRNRVWPLERLGAIKVSRNKKINTPSLSTGQKSFFDTA